MNPRSISSTTSKTTDKSIEKWSNEKLIKTTSWIHNFCLSKFNLPTKDRQCTWSKNGLMLTATWPAIAGLSGAVFLVGKPRDRCCYYWFDEIWSFIQGIAKLNQMLSDPQIEAKRLKINTTLSHHNLLTAIFFFHLWYNHKYIFKVWSSV